MIALIRHIPRQLQPIIAQLAHAPHVAAAIALHESDRGARNNAAAAAFIVMTSDFQMDTAPARAYTNYSGVNRDWDTPLYNRQNINNPNLNSIFCPICTDAYLAVQQQRIERKGVNQANHSPIGNDPMTIDQFRGI